MKHIRALSLAALVLAAAPALTGCQVLAGPIDKAATAAGKLVVSYCENVPDESVRQEIRQAVNAKAAPHSVTVNCAGAR